MLPSPDQIISDTHTADTADRNGLPWQSFDIDRWGNEWEGDDANEDGDLYYD